MSVGRLAEKLWLAHLDPNTTKEVLEQRALEFARAKQESRDRRDKWKLRRLLQSREKRDERKP